MIKINDTLREIILGNSAFGIRLGDSRDLVRAKIGDPVVWEGITDVLPASSRIWDYGAVQIFFQGTSTVQLLKVIFSEFFRDTLETDFTREDLGIDKSTKILTADLESMLFQLGIRFEQNIGVNKCPEYFFSSNCRAMFAPEAIFIGNQRMRGPVELFTIDIGWPPPKEASKLGQRLSAERERMAKKPRLSSDQILEIAEALLKEEPIPWEIVAIRYLEDSDENRRLSLANQWVAELHYVEGEWSPWVNLWTFDGDTGECLDQRGG